MPRRSAARGGGSSHSSSRRGGHRQRGGGDHITLRGRIRALEHQLARALTPSTARSFGATAIALQTPGVRAAVPEVLGSATVVRGEKTLAVTVIGVEPHRANDIAPLATSMVRGRLDLSMGNVLVGSGMMSELAVDVGDRLLLHASRGTAGGLPRDATVTVRGIFALGVSAVDERVMYMDLGQAKSLFGFENGVSLIELKIDDV